MGLTMDIDPRIEHLLRTDTPADPVHRPGLLRDRAESGAGRGGVVIRAYVIGSSPGLGLALLALGLVLLLAGVPLLTGGNRGVSRTPTTPVSPTSLQAALDTWAASTGARVTAVVSSPGGARWQGSAAATGSPPDPTTAVRIGEASSVLLANAVVILDECARGVAVVACPSGVPPLHLDDTLEKWIPGWGGRWIPGWAGDPLLTIRMLLDGTSGLPASLPLIADAMGPAQRPAGGWTSAEILAGGRITSNPLKPGAGHGPVDTEAFLLDQVVALASGEPTATFVTRTILDPLRLRATALPGTTPSNLEVGTTATGSLTDLSPDFVLALGVAEGVASNAPDLAALATATWGGTSLHDASSAADLATAGGAGRWNVGLEDGPPAVPALTSLVGRMGFAGGWSAAIAYDRATGVGLGITVDREVRDADLARLIGALLVPAR